MLWYLSLLVIVLAGIGLIAYSRNEAARAASASTRALGPTATDNWYVALGFDLCGSLQANLPTNANLPTAGIRTYGDGVVNVDPGSVKNSAAFVGANATLGTFVSTYGDHLALSARSLHLPGVHGKHVVSGARCPSSARADAGKRATLVTETWSSPTASGTISTGAPSSIRLRNGEMITVAFVPAGSPIPEPSSRPTLLQDLKGVTPASSSVPPTRTGTIKTGTSKTGTIKTGTSKTKK